MLYILIIIDILTTLLYCYKMQSKENVTLRGGNWWLHSYHTVMAFYTARLGFSPRCWKNAAFIRSFPPHEATENHPVLSLPSHTCLGLAGVRLCTSCIHVK